MIGCRALGDDKSGHGDAVEKQQSIGTPDSSQAGGDDDAQAGNMGNRFASVRRTREQGGNCASPEEAQHMLEADVSEAMSSVDPIQLVALSVGFYGAMTAAAIALGEANGEKKRPLALMMTRHQQRHKANEQRHEANELAGSLLMP